MTAGNKVSPLKLSENMITTYRDAFDVFDSDGNGTISPQELTALMRDLGQTPSESEVKIIMKKIDANNDGSIDFEEFVSLMSTRPKAAGNTLEEDLDLREAFGVFDKDGNGTINLEELRLTMRKIGVYLTDEELELMMKEADEDGNGVIDFQEFRRVVLLPPTPAIPK